MRNKILTICIVGMFLLASIATVSAVKMKTDKQPVIVGYNKGSYDLTFETVPGGCTCEVFSVGTLEYSQNLVIPSMKLMMVWLLPQKIILSI